MAKKNRPPVQTPRGGSVTNPQAGGQLSVSQIQVSGPLPPPAVLQGYENIKAGYADRIIGWAEEQGKHRRKWESREQWMGYGLDFLGMLLSFGFGAAALWFGVSLIREGHSTAGYVALVGALVPFVVAFLNRPKK